MRKLLPILFTARLFAAATPPGNGYLVHNLTADQPGVADFTDKNLVNPWGIDFSATGPFWVNDGGTGLSTVYTSSGSVATTFAIVPPGAGQPSPSVATGIVFNGTGGFPVAAGRAPNFIFCTANGTISGWNSAVDATHAQLMVDNSASGAVYYGLAISGRTTDANPLIYVANFKTGAIEVYDTNYKPATAAGGFTDSSVPAGYAPFNIWNIGGSLYVMYAQQNPAKTGWVNGAGLGHVAVFDLTGKLVKHLISGGALNAPWGVAMAGSNFGAFSGALLVGNFGDGKINAFDPKTGALMGTLADPQGNPIQIPGLWALYPGNGGNGGDTNAIYFAAGGASQNHGILGSIQAAPVVAAGAIGNTANTQPAGIAQNTYISIYGANLSPVTRMWATSDFNGNKLPTALTGVSVTVNGKPAYVYYVSPKQVNVLTPADTATGPVNVVVTSNGLVSGTVSVTMATASPALFLLKDNKSILATHADGSLVGAATLYPGASTPAKAGETIVLWATGCGQTNPAFPDGQILSTALPLAATPTVNFGGTSATVAYAGLQQVGVYQINVVVPAGTAAGDVPVTISTGSVSSATGTIITVGQ
ncbi:MAG TPA: TIGR03118 family protein [Verrucomicrobiae bacterium]|nr:TIGR03118 family protein [Verrucomicrobiae bacterium]